MSRWRNSPPSRASTRRRLKRSRTAPASYLRTIEAEFDTRREELGVADDLKEIEGVTSADAREARRERRQDASRIWRAAPPTISSAGASARTARRSSHAGYLDGIEISRDEAEAMIMAARVKAGWIEAPAPVEGEAEPQAEGA